MSNENWNQDAKLDQYRFQLENAAYQHRPDAMKNALHAMQDELWHNDIDGAKFANQLEARLADDGWLPQVKSGLVSSDYRFISDGHKKIDAGRLEEKARILENSGDYLEANFLRELDSDKQHKVIGKLDQKHLDQVSNRQNDRLGMQNVVEEFGDRDKFASLAGPKGYISKDDLYVALSMAKRDPSNSDPEKTVAMQYMYDNFKHMSKDVVIGRSPYDGGYATYARGITMDSLYKYDDKHDNDKHANKHGSVDLPSPYAPQPVQTADVKPEPPPAPPCDDACKDGLRTEGANNQKQLDKVDLDAANQKADSDRKAFGEKQAIYELATYQVKPDDGYILRDLAYSVLKQLGKPTTASDIKKEVDEIAKNSGLTRKNANSDYTLKPGQILTVLRPDQVKTQLAAIDTKYAPPEEYPD